MAFLEMINMKYSRQIWTIFPVPCLRVHSVIIFHLAVSQHSKIRNNQWEVKTLRKVLRLPLPWYFHPKPTTKLHRQTEPEPQAMTRLPNYRHSTAMQLEPLTNLLLIVQYKSSCSSLGLTSRSINRHTVLPRVNVLNEALMLLKGRGDDFTPGPWAWTSIFAVPLYPLGPALEKQTHLWLIFRTMNECAQAPASLMLSAYSSTALASAVSRQGLRGIRRMNLQLYAPERDSFSMPTSPG